MDLVSVLRLSLLLDAYGALLTPKQVSVLNSYINFNGSLSEIAEELNVTRQAVSDLVRRTTKLLEDYECKLMVISKLHETRKLLKGVTGAESKQLEAKLNNIWRG